MWIFPSRDFAACFGVHALASTALDADGHRAILGLDVTSGDDGAGWLAFRRGLVIAIRAALPGAARSYRACTDAPSGWT